MEIKCIVATLKEIYIHSSLTLKNAQELNQFIHLRKEKMRNSVILIF